MQVEAVCDDNLHFLDICAGWPGSVHDARVFRNSPLHQLLEDGNVLTQYMMVPFRDNGHLTEEQGNFNTRHSSARMLMKRAFGLTLPRYEIAGQNFPRNKWFLCHAQFYTSEREEAVEDIDLETNTEEENLQVEGGRQPAVNQRAAQKREMLVKMLA